MNKNKDKKIFHPESVSSLTGITPRTPRPKLLEFPDSPLNVPYIRIGYLTLFFDQLHRLIRGISFSNQDATGHRHTTMDAGFTMDKDAPAIFNDWQCSLYPAPKGRYGHRRKGRVNGG
jgi:hypothetical protein